jgi:hypothetical protein
MRAQGGVWIVGAVAAACGGAAIGVHASSAAPARAAARTSTSNATYSCVVSQQHFVNVYGGVTLPPVKNRQQPGALTLSTGVKTVVKDGVTTTVSQIGVGARKNSLKIDKSSCSRVKHQIPLKPKGLPPSLAKTATPTLFGHVGLQCGSGARVLVRLQLTTKAGVPTHALLAVRNGSAKKRPLAFYNWTPARVTAYSAASCTDLG